MLLPLRERCLPSRLLWLLSCGTFGGLAEYTSQNCCMEKIGMKTETVRVPWSKTGGMNWPDRSSGPA